MNARELHDLYSPLWCEVPETMPLGTGNRRLELNQNHGHKPFWVWCGIGAYKHFKSHVDDAAVEAICRVTVEHYLRLHRGGLATFDGMNDKDGLSWVRCLSDGTGEPVIMPNGEYEWSGETMHHALVNAAFAVSDAEARR